MNKLGKIISETRKIKGITQVELAELANVNIRTVQRIENSENIPRDKTLQLICEILEIDSKKISISSSSRKLSEIGIIIVNGLFLVAINLILMAIIGYLTLDTNANTNSRFGAFLLSFFVPFFIVALTKNMTGIERLLKFGSGFLIYFILVFIIHGFPVGFVTGLFPCLLLGTSVLYFGHKLFNINEEKVAQHRT